MDTSSLKNFNILNEKNKNMIIGLITVFIIIWSIVYAIPNFINSLFHTFLGIIILFLTVILISSNNIVYGIITALIFFILYRITTKSNLKEGFTWSQESIDKFIGLQQSINPNIVFDINKIKEQATQEEVDYFIKNGMWPWSKQVIQLYKNAVLNI
jgi:hypothetical protein